MKASRKALMLAVRNCLRLPQPTGGGYSDTECDCEPDDDFPPTSGQVYIAVMSGGFAPGPRHNTSGGVRDFVFGINVAVVRRIGNVPKDRKTELFIDNVDSIENDVDRIISILDWKEEVRQAANVIIASETGSSEGFITPLRLSGEVGPPQPVGAEKFGAVRGAEPAGMMVVIPLHGARRITTIL